VQLGTYLNQYGLDEGYLLIFDFRNVKAETGKVEEVQIQVGNNVKNIIEVYC
jgi:hypothetical protein